MRLTKVWGKLRKKNKEHYRQFYFCVWFAVMLIGSYLMMLCSPLVSETLPVGGDSRKQVYMIFCVAAVGCIIFVVYATGLFLRYKSREVGVFLALGTDKGRLSRALIWEMGQGVLKIALLGLFTGGILALLIGKIFEAIAKEATDSKFAFTLPGIGLGVLFSVVIFLIILVQAVRFMRRSNIMDILNEQRKQESVKKMVSPRYLTSGLLLTVTGLLVGFVLPTVVVNLFHHWLGGWTNLFYLLTLVGLYQIMVYSISCHRRGKNPQKYYRNLVSYGMLKFQGRSIVRNMLVITLLLAGGLFAAFYIPTQSSSFQTGLEKNEALYSWYYTEDADELTQEDVLDLAKNFGVEISNYREGEFVQAVGSGVNRDLVDENGNLIEQYEEQHAVYEYIGASQYEALTGEKISVEDGTYYMIQSPDAYENIFNKFDDMDKVYLDQEDTFLPLNFAGTVIYQSLVNGDWGFDINARYVVSDRDYERIEQGTGEYPKVRQVLFDSSRGTLAVDFCRELYRSFAQRMSDSMKVGSNYDAYLAKTSGEDSMYAMEAVYNPDIPVQESDWQFKPTLVLLEEENGLLTYAVYLLLFLYVAAICLAAVEIISYARSQTVGLAGRQVFEDLEKLGANHTYIRRVLKKQIQKVFVLPTVVGSLGILAFEVLMLGMNDGRYTSGEIQMIPVLLVVILAVALCQYLMYRFSVRKVTGQLNL